ncbi:hypothetical protein MNBD_GAMMA11-726 [hydrothermal vent metagenome]|uniref:PrcB C-terminal domain-containing protein n=1 Tax=hydrothermal vent metagenome TaxID=652676 RepID=A0A3B0X5E5_9ZZZZ
MNLQHIFLSIFALCLLFISGCNTGESIAVENTSIRKITLRSHYSSNQCGISNASVILINNKAELETIITRSRRAVLSDKPVTLPEINFSENLALLIALGTKSSAGYGIQLNADSAEMRSEKLILPVDIISPDKNGFQAQIMTSPCMIISFTKGGYTQIIVNEVLELQLEL